MNRFQPFRPAYTKRLVGRLLKGEKLFLLGTPAQGSTRLAEDLAELLPGATWIKEETDGPDPIRWKAFQEKPLGPVIMVSLPAQEIIHEGALTDLLANESLGLLLIGSKEVLGLPSAITSLRLPPIAYQRITEEIKALHPSFPYSSILARVVFSHPQPYPLLQFLLAQWPDVSSDGPEFWEDWVQEKLNRFNATQGLAPTSVKEEQVKWWQKVLGWMGVR